MPWIVSRPKMTEDAKAYCEQFGTRLKTEADIYSLRHYMDRDPYCKGKGFSFGLIGCAINGWAMKQIDAAGASKPPPPTDEEKQAKIRKANEMKAALLAKLDASRKAVSA